ncbi:MAG: hypothetical protein HYZ89_04295, partial [Candidatus Omnitrophica bacterium]|nr:hypothetical protein [Candidatus Omnitrophota bacterium]
MTRRDGLIPTCIISLLCVTPSTALEADTVHLKNGRRMTGKVVKQTTERIVLDVGMGTVTLRMAEVASIAHDDFSSVEPHRQSRAALAAHSDWDEIPPGRTPVSIPGGVDDEASRMQERVFVAPEETPSFLAKDPSSVQSAEALPRLADELLPVVAQLRGLTPHALITKRIASQATIRQIISQILARQRPDEEVANKGKTLIAFGLLPSSAHLQDILMRLYTQQAAGLYDPSTKVLYLADWIPAPLQAGTVAHELVHALQDQHFDLVRYFDEVKDDSEATTARHAVIEGEATAVMLAFQLRDVGDRGTELGELAQWTGSMAEVMAQQDPSLA